MPPQPPTIVVFDLGGVIVDWNPRYLLEKVIAEPARLERFLREVLSTPFFHVLDKARDSRAAVAPAIAAFPEFAGEIAAYVDRFPETILGEIAPMAALALRLRDAGVPIYGLTNWAGDTFDRCRPRLPTLDAMRDIVVSGHEGIAKPDHAIFRLSCARGGFAAGDAVFIDDNRINAEAATAFGMRGVHHRAPDETIAALRALGLPA